MRTDIEYRYGLKYAQNQPLPGGRFTKQRAKLLAVECVLISSLQAQKFIVAYAAFLKRQGKLPIPGSSSTYAI
jgi:4-hydroxybenzoate polyprenyltransferase